MENLFLIQIQVELVVIVLCSTVMASHTIAFNIVPDSGPEYQYLLRRGEGGRKISCDISLVVLQWYIRFYPIAIDQTSST